MKKNGLPYLILFLMFIFPSFSTLLAFETVTFEFTKDPIDVVIPCAEKDKETLDLCIEGIKKNCSSIRRVMVVSKTKLTDQAEWIDEETFPFSKDDIAFELFGDQLKANAYKADRGNRLGWIYQQILKLYAPLVIKDISPNVLILDADTIFLRTVRFIAPNGAACFNPGIEFHTPYFDHMKRLLPDLHRVNPQWSGITNHMLFQKCVLVDLKSMIETYNKKPMWKALVNCIDDVSGSGISEYEIYFNYALLRSKQFTIRKLMWMTIPLSSLAKYRDLGYQYISAHSYMR